MRLLWLWNVTYVVFCNYIWLLYSSSTSSLYSCYSNLHLWHDDLYAPEALASTSLAGSGNNGTVVTPPGGNFNELPNCQDLDGLTDAQIKLCLLFFVSSFRQPFLCDFLLFACWHLWSYLLPYLKKMLNLYFIALSSVLLLPDINVFFYSIGMSNLQPKIQFTKFYIW